SHDSTSKVGKERGTDDPTPYYRVLSAAEAWRIKFILWMNILGMILAAFVTIFCAVYGWNQVTEGPHFVYSAFGPIGYTEPNGTYENIVAFSHVKTHSFFWVNYLFLVGIVWFICTFFDVLMSVLGRFYDTYLYDFFARGCNHLLWINVTVGMGFLGMFLNFALRIDDQMQEFLAFLLFMLPFLFLYVFQSNNMAPKMGELQFNDWIVNGKGKVDERGQGEEDSMYPDDDGIVEEYTNDMGNTHRRTRPTKYPT